MKLTFEKVDEIWTATGENHYYRTFPTENGWVVFVHRCDGGDVENAARGIPVGATSYENAQAFAQAFEDSTVELLSGRLTQATRAVFLQEDVQ